jgi:hypothetical protein
MMRVLEGRAEAVAGTMNAQEVANTLWACVLMGREPGAGLVLELEGRAEAVAGTMNAQEVANTLWAYATMGREPGGTMKRKKRKRRRSDAELEKGREREERRFRNLLSSFRALRHNIKMECAARAEELKLPDSLGGVDCAGGAGGGAGGHVHRAERGKHALGVCDDGAALGLMRALEVRAGTFNAQDVANTLWAYATMGRKPGAGLMRVEGRAEALAGTFNAQNVANTLWAYAKLGREHGEGLVRCWRGGKARLKPDASNAHAASVNTGGKHGESCMPSLETSIRRMDVDEVKIEEKAPEVADTAPEAVGRCGMAKGVARRGRLGKSRRSSSRECSWGRSSSVARYWYLQRYLAGRYRGSSAASPACAAKTICSWK